MNEALIGLDIGTTGCKGIVVDNKLNILSEAYMEYPLINISEKEVEQDANDWWEASKHVVKSLIQKAGKGNLNVRGIAVSSQGITFVPIDKNINPLRNAISWLDTRAIDEASLILEKYNKEYLYKITGKSINEIYTLPKLMWIKRNEYQLYENTHKFLMLHDFIVAKLCGKFITDHTIASGTLAYDINSQNWWKEILSDFNIDINKLPEIKYSGNVAGNINPKIAFELGLKENVVICVGGQDQKCAALGAGLEESKVSVSLGTSTAIESIFNKPILDEKMRVPVFSYLFKGKWVMEGVISTSSVSLKWLKDTFFMDCSYTELDNMATDTNEIPANVFFYPFLGGMSSPNWYEEAKGTFYGINLSTTRGEMIKSVMEGIAYQIRCNLEVMKTNHNIINEIMVFGGGAVSDLWCQIISDITDKDVKTLFTAETASLGAAILAGLGCGLFSGIEEIEKNICVRKVFKPRKHMVKAYNEKYFDYITMQARIMSKIEN